MRGIHQWRVNSPHKGPLTQKMFPFGDVIMAFKLMENNSFGWYPMKILKLCKSRVTKFVTTILQPKEWPSRGHRLQQWVSDQLKQFLGTTWHWGPYKPCNHSLYIGIISADVYLIVTQTMQYVTLYYRKVSNIRRTKCQNLNESRLVLQLSVPNPLKPSVKSIMKM